jgi:hypothetical protein
MNAAGGVDEPVRARPDAGSALPETGHRVRILDTDPLIDRD